VLSTYTSFSVLSIQAESGAIAKLKKEPGTEATDVKFAIISVSFHEYSRGKEHISSGR